MLPAPAVAGEVTVVVTSAVMPPAAMTVLPLSLSGRRVQTLVGWRIYGT